jgi:hypothetical protein
VSAWQVAVTALAVVFGCGAVFGFAVSRCIGQWR